MKILALEAYYGGSHKAFLDGWAGGSEHEWTVVTLAAYKWKWRMRHAAVTFADEVGELVAKGGKWDAIFCSDMLNLAEFVGLAPAAVRELPAVVYFHENQLTYPVRFESERDYQFAMTNMTTALAGKSVWFNSGFHRDSFLGGLEKFLKKMPDCRPMGAIEKIRDKSAVYWPGVEVAVERGGRKDGPLRIVWAARWEHDKNPEGFFAALKILKGRGREFRVSVIGEQFRQGPEVFGWAEEYFAGHIERWGYQDSRGEYEAALAEADVFVSTAEHEFFGISAVEAGLAGCYPVLPRRLAYPEIMAGEFLYDGSVAGLAERLEVLAGRVENGDLWGDDSGRLVRLMERYKWGNLCGVLDAAVERVAGG